MYFYPFIVMFTVVEQPQDLVTSCYHLGYNSREESLASFSFSFFSLQFFLKLIRKNIQKAQSPEFSKMENLMTVINRWPQQSFCKGYRKLTRAYYYKSCNQNCCQSYCYWKSASANSGIQHLDLKQRMEVLELRLLFCIRSGKLVNINSRMVTKPVLNRWARGE